MAGTQDKINRVRKPRVHITYDVETGGATVKRELPFVVGVLGDFSGDPTAPLPKLENRKFVKIDRDNFNQVLAGMNPGLKYKVNNVLPGGEGKEIGVNLKFSSLDDFSPAAVAEQVPEIAALLEKRRKLEELRSLADRQEGVEEKLAEILADKALMAKLKTELGVAAGEAK